MQRSSVVTLLLCAFSFAFTGCNTMPWEPEPRRLAQQPSSRSLAPPKHRLEAPKPQEDAGVDPTADPSRELAEKKIEPVFLPLAGQHIIIDAGHGDHDPGTMGSIGVPEKVINLAVAKELGRILSARGATVLQTRTRDTFVDLDTRAALADRKKTDLFLSIHADAASRASARGATLYLAPQASRTSQSVATAIDASFRRAGLSCRGLRQAKFRVLVGHQRPSVLVECGFMSNPQEAKLLNTPSYRTRLVNAIVEGVVEAIGANPT